MNVELTAIAVLESRILILMGSSVPTSSIEPPFAMNFIDEVFAAFTDADSISFC